ncbi:MULTISPECIES: SDR family NAD(P)-dependent oxidoreductase [Amycolatopsis]|uniref:SDR family NAD(P)-dependent oxidoreductase n=1 Tax=Amycolatopsis TaxID=1813 RepID=UPI000B8B1133|nr:MULTISPECIES: SDR family NAD(P)-dependent oxidoreductase [Amycolatopsis]OXM67188.1 short-chain dehydrogenase [Amycolatopsis sp. KNN50.9b]
MHPAGRLAGKVAIVTGGASVAGLGFATARLFAREGAAIFLTDVSPEVKERAGEFPSGARVETAQQDVTSEEAWVATFEAARAAFGSVDILVNNAGITRRDPIDEMSFETYRAVVDTNLTGAWLGCKHAVREMKRSGHGGAIVNIASISGVVGMRYSSPYGSSKGGIRSLTKVVALETARDGIRCNAVCPGIIGTDIVTPVEAKNPDAFQVLLDGIPMGQVGEPNDIAQAALYLASDDARYVTGAEIVVDGGYTAQ